MASNYDDVVCQLESVGLIFDSLVVGKLTRCKVEGEGEKRGWYSLHEITLDGGDQVLVGSYGIWYGDDNGHRKIELRRRTLTDEQKAALRARLKEDRKRAEGLRMAQAEAASAKAERKWGELSSGGEHDYLTRKGVGAHGVRFAPEGTRIDFEAADGKIHEVDVAGALGVPMCDTAGRVWGLQFILSREHSAERIQRLGRDKEYWPQGLDKIGKFHWLGGVPETVVLVAEGYATGASAHAATGLPVAVSFDANNLGHVAQAIHKKYKRVRIGFLADDDAFAKCRERSCQARLVVADSPSCPACGQMHGRQNTGVVAADTAALAVNGFVLAPRFADEAARRAAWLDHGQKLTDWNDLHARAGLAVVRSQIEDGLAGVGLATAPARRAAAPPRGEGGGGSAGPVEIRPVSSLSELLERFVIIYGEGDVVFDRELHKLVKLKDVQNLTLSREVYARWTESADKQFAMLDNVGFDPTGRDTMVSCNVYAGWPTVPKAGSCELLLELLWYLCSGERNAEEVYDWLLKWLAYPIQHPGAKMASAVVIHGKQGTGKTMFFKAITRIYGTYGLTINQSAVDNPRNTWLASRLYVLAEEVVARKELHHVKNALKDLITGDTVYVDPKFVNPYPERNHVNITFLSNETLPVILEDDDRRHLVVWTPEAPQSGNFYRMVEEEIEAGGIAALHDHLLNLPLGDFHKHTKPPMTRSKEDLIDLSLDSTTRFWRALVQGEIEGVRPKTIALSTDFYKLYAYWCSQIGVHAAPMPKLIDTLKKKHGMKVGRKRWSDQYKTHGPHGVCMIPEHQPGGGTVTVIEPERPPDLQEPVWIGRLVEAFRAAVRDYKGGGHV
ncbi:DNA primase [Pseudothauera nasutitermitis]|uniref:DNA primase n=1 Tax=Pseudothauera nasutitermitis TaxID=2565930 RepID=A0A4V3WB06_9RHOO|nr:DUF5906 domain-containing protein [Pseudothauera nasutitermitis]THF61415.1 DNA primase [Pseudothauera nasutitermitis]